MRHSPLVAGNRGLHVTRSLPSASERSTSLARLPQFRATYLSSQLNACLPEGYFAEANVPFDIEIDVAAFETGIPEERQRVEEAEGLWKPAAPHSTFPLVLGEPIVEIGIFHQEGGPTLAGAIELVSPANKDCPAHREAFVSRCAAYLQQGLGLVVLDVVTDRQGNLHVELLERLHAGGSPEVRDPLYSAAYRPVRRGANVLLEVWYERQEVGQVLPTLPLWLRGGHCLRVEFQSTYARTCREKRVVASGPG